MIKSSPVYGNENYDSSVKKEDALFSDYENAKKAKQDSEAQIYYLNGLKSFSTLTEDARNGLLIYIYAHDDDGVANETYIASHAQQAADAVYKATKKSMSKDDFTRMIETLFAMKNSVASAENNFADAKFANDHPVASNVVSVFTSLFGGIAATGEIVGTAVGNIGKDEEYTKPIDVNAQAFVLSNATNTIRSTTSDKIEYNVGGTGGKIASFLYQTGMSAADSFAASFTGNWGGAVLLGSGAAANAFTDAKERGANDSQAIWTGLFAGVFETLFEKFSIGELNALKETPVATIKDIFKNVAKSAGVNAWEEGMTEAANAVSDYLINLDNSTIMQTYNAYLANGKSESDAWRATLCDTLTQIGLSSLAGAIMGAGMSGGVGTYNYATGKNANAEVGSMYRNDNGTFDRESVEALIGEGLASQDAETNRYAESIQKKADKADEKELGLLQRMLASEQQDAVEESTAGSAVETQQTQQEQRVQSADDPYASVRSHLSEDGRIALDAAIKHAGDASPAAVAATVEQQYLKGFTGGAYSQSAEFLPNAVQRAAYDAGVQAKASLGTVTVTEGVNISDGFKDTLSRVAKDLDTHITYGGTAPVQNGLTERGYSTKYGELHIYADAKVTGADGTTLYGERAASVIIAGHEITHRLQQLAPNEYAAFRDLAVEQLGGKEAVATYMREHNLDDTDAMDEITANYAMEKLFYDEKTIAQITKKHSKLAQAIRNILAWIKEKLHLSSDIDRTIRLWNDAYNAASRNAKNPQVHNDIAQSQAGAKQSRNSNLDEQGKVKYNSSIQWVYDAGLFDGKQARHFFSVVADIKQKKYQTFVKARTGEKIIEVDNMLVYFYGGYANPKISQIVRINSECETDVAIIRENFYDFEKGKSSYNQTMRLLEDVFGEGIVDFYEAETYESSSRQTRRGERIDSGETAEYRGNIQDRGRDGHESRGTDNLTNEADSEESAFSMPKQSLSGGEEMIAELEAMEEREKNTASSVARKLVLREEGARASGRRYTMSLDTFEQVAREYASRYTGKICL